MQWIAKLEKRHEGCDHMGQFVAVDGQALVVEKARGSAAAVAGGMLGIAARGGGKRHVEYK